MACRAAEEAHTAILSLFLEERSSARLEPVMIARVVSETEDQLEALQKVVDEVIAAHSEFVEQRSDFESILDQFSTEFSTVFEMLRTHMVPVDILDDESQKSLFDFVNEQAVLALLKAAEEQKEALQTIEDQVCLIRSGMQTDITHVKRQFAECDVPSMLPSLWEKRKQMQSKMMKNVVEIVSARDKLTARQRKGILIGPQAEQQQIHSLSLAVTEVKTLFRQIHANSHEIAALVLQASPSMRGCLINVCAAVKELGPHVRSCATRLEELETAFEEHRQTLMGLDLELRKLLSWYQMFPVACQNLWLEHHRRMRRQLELQTLADTLQRELEAKGREEMRHRSDFAERWARVLPPELLVALQVGSPCFRIVTDDTVEGDLDPQQQQQQDHVQSVEEEEVGSLVR